MSTGRPSRSRLPRSSRELIRDQHQCLIAGIAFDPDLILAAATPGTSDNYLGRRRSHQLLQWHHHALTRCSNGLIWSGGVSIR